MDQINTGVVKLKQYAAGSHVQGTRTDFSTKREEPIFDVLIGQKQEQYSSGVTDKARKPETSEQGTAQEKTQETVEKTEKPVAGKEEEEACDVAREAAAAQIVWYVEPNAIHLKAPEQMEQVVVIEKPMVFGITDEPAKPIEEIMGMNLTDGSDGEVDGEQTTVMDIMSEIESETVAEMASANEETAVAEIVHETGINTHKAENVGDETDANNEENGAEAVDMEKPLFEDVKVVPIKVAEAPERSENSASVDQQVAVKVSDLLESGETRVQIQLEPVELGKLTIELARSSDGTLSVVLDAENAQTRNLLEKHMGILQETLTDRGQRAVQITIVHNEESQSQDNQQRDDFYDGRNGQHHEQQQRRDDRSSSADFLQQLRLGLIPLEDEEDN